ncbi:MAG: prepilin-type N-terminal cleavage/methylation domain-containing protein [Candidatus Hydrogenedentes bacterium]|nr:prepilin-type N-terminal cleavage/methylation domain-containing protein [Candidatus Hydrogenedentota bacterium]
MMTRRIEERRALGFTLLELLIGTIISAVLLAALYSAFQGMLRTQSHAYAVLEETVPRSHIADVIRKDIANMVIPNAALSGNLLGQTLTQGDDRWDTLEFFTTTARISNARPWGETQKVYYALVDADPLDEAHRLQLTRTVTRNLLPPDTMVSTINGMSGAASGDLIGGTDDSAYSDADTLGDTTVLLDDVSSLAIEYYDGETWTDTWDSAQLNKAIPSAVHVRIGFETLEDRGIATAPIDVMCEVAAQNPVTEPAA